MPAYFGETANACALDRCITHCADHFHWKEKYPVRDMGNGKVRTAGMAIAMQGSCISNVDVGSCTLKLSDDGTYNMLIGAADMGTGCDTILAQMAAEVLDCEPDQIVVFGADTDASPYDSGSYASSTTYVTGMATQNAAMELRENMMKIGAELLGCTLDEVEFDGEKYYLDYNRPDSIGKLRKFYGVPAVLVRTYAYIRTLGPDGMKQIAEMSILNNNYMLKKLLEIKGISLPYAKGKYRLEQARLSWKELTDETGVTTDDICRRIVDYGFQDYFTSHHPRIIPEPFTPEPVESYSKDDIDEFVDAYRQIAEEAYTTPQVIKEAPHHAALGSRIQEDGLTEWKKFATTWRAYIKMKKDS